ncbi:MFS transporter [Streptomyces sp. QH1-20]|uniref:MFS transporter n=1 Tax=Streptomyces sp. QH1-20 TaxID=3240934 RepID=UPI0035166A1B
MSGKESELRTTGAGTGTAPRDFLYFWTAGAVDGLGTYASALFLPLILLASGSSPGTVGLVASVSLVGGLLVSPFAGVLADRGCRRALMVRSALVAAGAMGSVFVAVAWGRVTPAHVLLAALVERVACALYAAAAQGTVRALVPPERYTTAISRLQSRDQAVQIVGPSLGGALFQLARWVPVLADALSFLCVAVLTHAIRADLTPSRAARRDRFTRELAEGLRFVRREPFLRFVTLWTAGLNAVLGVLYFHAVLASHARGAGAAAIGLILTVSGLCGLAGALAGPWVIRRLGPVRVVVAASWLMVPAAAGLGFVTHTWAYGLLLGTVSLAAPAVGIVLHARVVLLTPDRLQGRVGTVLGTAGETVAALAPAAAGALVAWTGGRAVAFGSAGALVGLAGYCTARRGLVHGAGDPARRPEGVVG